MEIFLSTKAAALRLFAFVMAVLLLSSSSEAQANDIRLCYNEWPPYLVIEEGVVTGITIDIMRSASERAGIEISFHELPWNRCLQMVRTGQYDGVLDAAERPEFLQGPTSFSAYTNTFWVHEDSELLRFEFEAIAGTTVGLVDGYTYPQPLLDMLKKQNVSVDYAIDDANNIRKLAFGRVDAIIADYVSTLSIARENDLKVRPIAPTHSRDRLYASFHSGRAKEQKLLNDALAQLLNEGLVDQVYRKHLGVGYVELGLE